MKSCLTLGIVKGAPVVLMNPSLDVTEHVAFLKNLTDKKGKMSDGKKTIDVEEACIVHTSRGVLKSRRFK